MSTTASQLSNATTFGTVKLRAAARTDVGRRRSENQDSYGYLHTARTSLFVVADGMGGARGGGTASAMAVNIIIDGIIVDGALAPGGEITVEGLEGIISLSNKVIFTRSQAEPTLSGMGTTVVALAFVNDRTIVAHVGDSRIYSWRDNSLHQLTRDHTLVQELVDTGAIPPQDAANHPIAHMLTRSLGPTEAIGVEIHLLPNTVRPGDKYLLCSDGLYNHVSAEEIARVLSEKDPGAAADELIQLALDGGGSDNVTLQIVEALSLSDEIDGVHRPSDGSADKLIVSEINVLEFDGTSLAEYTRQRAAELQAKPQTPPQEESAAASTNGRTRLTARAEGESDGQTTMVVNENVTEYLNSLSDTPRAAPAHFALIIALTAFVAFVGYWFFFIPVSPTHVTQAPPAVPETVATQPEPGSVSSAAVSSAAVSSAAVSSAAVSSAAVASSAASSSESSVAQTSSVTAAAESSAAAVSSAIGVSSAQSAAIIEQPVEPTEAEIRTENYRKYSELLSAAAEIRIPPAPRLSLGGDGSKSPAPDQPIVWDRETRMIENILGGQQPPLPGETLGGETAKLRTVEERVELADKKEQLREKLFDIDAKLELLVSETKEQAKNKQTRVEMEISRLGEAKSGLEDDLRSAVSAMENWDRLQKKSAGADQRDFIDEVAGVSEDVKQKRNQYSDATDQYLAATDKWQTNPKDSELATMMAALGRDIKTKRLELESAVTTAISRGLALNERRIGRLRFDLANLKRRQDQLNRHVGLLRAFAPSPLPRRKEMQRKLLEERAGLLENLKGLSSALNDEDEAEFRLKNSELFYAG